MLHFFRSFERNVPAAEAERFGLALSRACSLFLSCTHAHLYLAMVRKQRTAKAIPANPSSSGRSRQRFIKIGFLISEVIRTNS